MNKEEIDDWLRYFSNNNQSFMSKDGKIITLFKVFQELKELQRLLKIQNDYINELEAYKYNMDRDYLRLEKENKELISAILNWNIFKNECPMNFGYDKNTIEDKAQEVFYENDDYCENNCNDDYKKCWLKYFRKMQELEKSDSNE